MKGVRSPMEGVRAEMKVAGPPIDRCSRPDRRFATARPTSAYQKALSRSSMNAFWASARMGSLKGETTMSSNTVSQVNIATQKVTVEAEYLALIAGFGTDLAGVDPVVLLDTSYARAALLAKFQSRVDASQATKASRASLRTAVSSEQALDAEVGPLRQAMKQYLQSRFGKNSPKLQAFGFTEAKRPQKSAQSKAGAVVKMQATRDARHIMGKKQRLAIKAPAGAADETPAPAPETPATV